MLVKDCPSTFQAYEKLSEDDIPAIQSLLAMAENLISKTDSKALTVHMPVLLDLFSKTLEIRTQKVIYAAYHFYIIYITLHLY